MPLGCTRVGRRSEDADVAEPAALSARSRRDRDRQQRRDRHEHHESAILPSNHGTDDDAASPDDGGYFCSPQGPEKHGHGRTRPRHAEIASDRAGA